MFSDDDDEEEDDEDLLISARNDLNAQLQRSLSELGSPLISSTLNATPSFSASHTSAFSFTPAGISTPSFSSSHTPAFSFASIQGDR